MSNKKFIFDERWIGEHGIGRFAKEVRKCNLDFENIGLTGNPAGKLDVLKLTIFLLFKKDKYYFSPGYNAPYFFINRSVITIHDLNHIDIDSNSSLLKRIYYNYVLKRACKRALIIFTVSNFSKKRIIEWSNADDNKVIVVGNGVSEEFNRDVVAYQNGLPYFFIVGNRKDHKNEGNALLAFLNAKISNNYQLIMTGDASPQLTETLVKNNSVNRVKFLGKVTNKELASLYKGATCLLFPSLYEGFGLPVIESMACGTPVITSNTTSLPEVSQGAALLVDPKSLSDITAAIETIVNNEDVCISMVEKGYRQAAKFQWSKTRRIIEDAINLL
ncbi:D-inositol-3-phosphate glycosyltransferase [Serratia proteamaculans]|uniref:glycosyltransferase family 4 protein n=1 Tax=Serratia proteamaculans TaxID=28151 RepID=UPI00217B01A2|nr:glycosyltransferase family 1 protein [Serratia proteamaculans]CAI0779770.1 D-inositol-3-phosphate glycosyltransferase [Serratia proteamaculans]CAI1568931.1 D-inositol-3-phosphate glycosyltransferase [Serratia proteamaculans]